MCARFLWSGSIETKSASKVAWNSICLPKEEGGLGLRRFTSWNKVLCIRFIWLLFSNSNSLWSRWHKHFHLRNTSFRAIQPKSTDSAAWRSILNLRPMAEQFIKCTIRNGKAASFWFDSWTPFGQLIKFLGSSGPRDLNLTLQAKVSDAANATGWRIPSPRSENALDLHIHLTTRQLPLPHLEEDSYHWIVDSVDCSGFSSSQTWEFLRPRSRKKRWTSSVWYKGAVPRHAFNMWLASQNRLPTKVRFAAWGLNVQQSCGFCNQFPETREHLFLACDYSASLWNRIFARLQPHHQLFLTWGELLSWTRQASAQAPPTLRILVTQVTIYNIWRQRNSALHLNGFTNTEVTFKTIDREVRNTISARRHKKSFSSLMSLWIR